MPTILEAHRGLCTDAPENTLAAYRMAVKLGYGMIELDPKFTSDNHCVLLHDRTVNRTGRLPNGEKYPIENARISEMTLEEARKLEYGSWFAPQFAGEPLPLLSEVLEFAIEVGIPLKFDNVLESFTDEQQEIFFSELEKMNRIELLGVTAYSLEFAKKAAARLPGIHIHFDGTPSEENFAALAEFLPKEQLTVWLRHANSSTAWCKTPPVTAEAAARVKQIGTLGIWILRRQSELDEALALCEPDYVETDGSLKP